MLHRILVAVGLFVILVVGYIKAIVQLSILTFVQCIPDKPTTTQRRGFTGKGKNITTKHDEVVCGRKNTARMDNVRVITSSPFALVQRYSIDRHMGEIV